MDPQTARWVVHLALHRARRCVVLLDEDAAAERLDGQPVPQIRRRRACQRRSRSRPITMPHGPFAVSSRFNPLCNHACPQGSSKTTPNRASSRRYSAGPHRIHSAASRRPELTATRHSSPAASNSPTLPASPNRRSSWPVSEFRARRTSKAPGSPQSPRQTCRPAVGEVREAQVDVRPALHHLRWRSILSSIHSSSSSRKASKSRVASRMPAFRAAPTPAPRPRSTWICPS